MSKRDYSNVDPKIVKTYKLNHENQTLQYTLDMEKHYNDKPKIGLDLWQVTELANEIIDESDPDINLPQIYHSLQTAEALRTKFPDRKDLHLVGLIHDLGKIMLLGDFGELPQWSVVGDIFPVGCKFSDKIIFNQFFENNPDFRNEKLNTKYGIYEPNCGFDNVKFSWSHDTYLYNVLNKKCELSDNSLKIIKYHSFYAFHKEHEYEYLANENDMKLLDDLKIFSNCDLYNKDDNNKLDIDDLKPYYGELIDEYCPGKFDF
jgi:inositol oxygenase